MEAAVRTAYEIYTGKTLEKIDFEEVRGLDGVKEASVELDGTTLKIAVAHGLGNARDVLDRVKSGEAEYHLLRLCHAQVVHRREAGNRFRPMMRSGRRG